MKEQPSRHDVSGLGLPPPELPLIVASLAQELHLARVHAEPLNLLRFWF